MKTAPIVCVLALSVAYASACMAGNTDLANYKTFGWDPSQKNQMTENPRSVSAVTRRAVVDQMLARGYRLDVGRPQLILRLDASVENAAGADPSDTALTLSDFTLRVSDAKTGELLWSDSADIAVTAGAGGKLPAGALQDAVGELYADYPVAPLKSTPSGHVTFPETPFRNAFQLGPGSGSSSAGTQ